MNTKLFYSIIVLSTSCCMVFAQSRNFSDWVDPGYMSFFTRELSEIAIISAPF
jgi:hypothetical protein